MRFGVSRSFPVSKFSLSELSETSREKPMSRTLKHSKSVPVVHVSHEIKAPSQKRLTSRRKTSRRISKRVSDRKESKLEKWMKLAESANNKVANFSLPRPDGNANSLSTSQYVTFYEAGPILLTCPHSIRLKRDDHEDHKPEPLVLDLIKLFTIEFGPTKASSVFWSNAASKNFSNNRDPNYLHIKELKSNPWHNCLKTHQQRHGAIAIHFDFHGMRGKKHGSDLAMGIEPLERFLSEEPYTQIPFVLEEELRSILEPRGFVVKQVPSMSGFRKDKDSLSPRAKQKSKRRKEREKRERILSNPCIRFFFCIPPLDELTEEEERIQTERDRLRKKLRENRKIAPLGGSSGSSSSSLRY